MNRDHVLRHLQEAEEELARTIADIRRNPDFDVGELIVAMQHVYHHLNNLERPQLDARAIAERH